jgi:hypothetical protein
MSDCKHTPGPWVVDTEQPNLIRASGKTDGNQIVVADASLHTYIAGCIIHGEKKIQRMLEKQQSANIKLISAAPDLLDNLKYCIEALRVTMLHNAQPIIDRAQLAIQKATL